MLKDLLKKFDALPAAVREPVSSAQAVKALEQIEIKYNVSLGIVAIRVMVKDIPLGKLIVVLENEMGKPLAVARVLAEDLKNNFFAPVLNYLETRTLLNADDTTVFTSKKSELFSDDVQKQLSNLRGLSSDGAKLRDLLHQALLGRDRARIFGLLTLLAESGELLYILKTDSRFYYLLANYYRHQKRLNELKEFHMSFADPRYLKELVRYILGEQLKLSEDEAAHIGADLVNLMRGKDVGLKHWSYFDMKTSTYKWL